MALLGGMREAKKVFDHYHCITVGYKQLLYSCEYSRFSLCIYASVHVFTVYRTLYASDRFKEDLVTEMLNVLGTGEMAGNNFTIPNGG